ARLMVNRVNLLLFLDNPELRTSLDYATLGAEKGENIKEIIAHYAASPGAQKMQELKLAIDDMHVYYTEFADSINAISLYANSLLLWGILVITILLITITILLSGYISRMISASVFKLVDNFKEMVKGNIDKKIEIETHDELGTLAGSFAEMQSSLQEIVDQMQKIADGDYDVHLDLKSEKDRLTLALNKMTRALRDTSLENESQNWLKSGQNALNEKMRGDRDLMELTSAIITYLAEYLDAQVGAVYLVDESGRTLSLYGSYAFTRRKQLNDRFKMGEGLVGQAAFGRQTISLSDVPEDYTRITSATGDMRPRNVVVQPLIYDQDVIGVIELASKKEFGNREMDFLSSISENIAISINSSRSRVKLKELLEQTQQQAEELQTQQEELKVANEELEEQTKALRESEKELQAQQEELRVINEELEEKTHSLELQKTEIATKNLDLLKMKEDLEDKAEQLELTSKYKSEFLANMSHELRTPLNSLLILSKNLVQNKNDNLNDDQLESLEIIRKSGHDLLNLINEILDLSKIESGKMSLNVEEIRVSTILKNVKNNFSHMISEKGLELNLKSDPAMPATIATDLVRIEQLIKNLISNAIKFTHQGSITVSFQPAPADRTYQNPKVDPQEYFAMSVSDTGIGIPREKQLIIFEAFQQADGSTSRKYGGTGLGLSICKEIAKLFRGEIHLKSEEGKGSTFTVYLPYRFGEAGGSAGTTAEPMPSIPEIPVKIDSKTHSKGSKISLKSIDDDRDNLKENDRVILVVEDDPVFAKVLRKQCYEKHFRFLHAPTGETGLAMAEKYKPDAIILDIKLPGIDGITVLDRIKDNPKIRHIPVHMMSALEESIDVFRKGAIGYLTKPIDTGKMDEAFEKLETMINKKVKDLLIIEDDTKLREQIIDIIGREDVEPIGVGTAKEAIEVLKKNAIDCIVLDLGLPDMPGFELLKKLENDEDLEVPPVIIYTGKELSREESRELKKYADSIIIKGVKSEERLLDETALFLHRVVDHLPKSKQKIISTLHDKDAVFRGKKVLVVDDDMRNVFALSKILDEKGMKIIEAENGKVALEKLEKEKDVDIVLMDIMMPVMDGFEAMRQIRKNPAFRNLPIISLTAKAMKDDQEKCIAAGASDYLAKPIDIEKLISLMNVWLYK
ncbi:MAG: response regulator, partial [Bacteroidales bacterium]